ncbi:hypothetical protein E2P63_03825 [Candidatus Bathyarchaeota archaeon]|nr:hypothetical protein E2P63_03825 [Candidatus Bathyarchaeota archaeon]
MKKFFVAVILVLTFLFSACAPAADVASRNLSKEADQFRINRRIVFYNGITDSYMLTIEGLCSIGNYDSAGEVTITCKTGVNSYKKHFLGLSDNVTYFVEQLEEVPVNTYNYKVIFRPETIVPNIELDTSNQ